MVLLPGGAVALRGPDAILVSDPVETVVFNQAEVKQLRRVLRNRADVSTLSHTSGGVVLRRRVPKHLPPQAVTLVPNAKRLPVRVPFTGPVLIQWGLHGAVARPLVDAPALLALAISLAPSPRVAGGPGVAHEAPTFAPETWQAVDARDRWQLIATSVQEHVSELLADTVCDELRYALVDACVTGPDSLANRIAKAIAILPTSFVADPASLPISLPEAWRPAMVHIRDLPFPRALLGLDKLPDPVAAIRRLRDIMEQAEIIAFDKDGEVLLGHPVSLHSDAALFMARVAGTRGRVGVAVPVSVSPVELYVLASDVSAMTEGRVIAIAPCWGFCHHVEPDGQEYGNAGWFGMGAGLDETDLVIGDIEPADQSVIA
jgi:hypothetical protein